jgi:hypothetical protein
MSTSNGKLLSKASALHCSSSCLCYFKTYKYFVTLSTASRVSVQNVAELRSSLLKIPFFGSANLGIRIYSWKVSSSGFRIYVLPQSSGCLDNFPAGIVKRLAVGKECIICYLVCLISEFQLLLVRYNIGSICPFGGSDWSQFLWTCLHNWSSFSSHWLRCLPESNATKMKMEEGHSFEMSESTRNSASCRNPEGYHMSNIRLKNLKNFNLAQSFFGFCLIPPYFQVGFGMPY